jgi:hypothetical protein
MEKYRTRDGRSDPFDLRAERRRTEQDYNHSIEKGADLEKLKS